jgi:hypothetical protein
VYAVMPVARALILSVHILQTLSSHFAHLTESDVHILQIISVLSGSP